MFIVRSTKDAKWVKKCETLKNIIESRFSMVECHYDEFRFSVGGATPEDSTEEINELMIKHLA